MAWQAEITKIAGTKDFHWRPAVSEETLNGCKSYERSK
jgi:hypothetical protein